MSVAASTVVWAGVITYIATGERWLDLASLLGGNFGVDEPDD